QQLPRRPPAIRQVKVEGRQIEKRKEHIAPTRDISDRIRLDRVDGEDEGSQYRRRQIAPQGITGKGSPCMVLSYRRTAGLSDAKHPVAEQEYQHGICRMQHNIG